MREYGSGEIECDLEWVEESSDTLVFFFSLSLSFSLPHILQPESRTPNPELPLPQTLPPNLNPKTPLKPIPIPKSKGSEEEREEELKTELKAYQHLETQHTCTESSSPSNPFSNSLTVMLFLLPPSLVSLFSSKFLILSYHFDFLLYSILGLCANHCLILYVYVGELGDTGGVLTFYVPAIIDEEP